MLKRLNKTISLLLAVSMLLGSQTGMTVQAKDREATDGDLAKEAEIVADCPVLHSNAYGGYDVKLINDGDDSTGWVSEKYTTSRHKKHWVYVDFGSPKTFDEIQLVWDDVKYAQDYKIQVSNTARDSDWYDRAEVTGNDKGGKKKHEIESTTARYVRVYTTKNVTKDETIQLNTFSVFQNKKGVSDKDAVEKDLEFLTEDVVKTSSGLYQEIANTDLKNVKASLNLPKTGFASSDITWSVMPNDGNINLETGEVIRGNEDKDYELTATISKGDVSKEKTFDVTVKANKVLASRIVEGEDRNYLELNGSPFLYVTVQNCGTQQLYGDNGNRSFKEVKPEGFTDLYGDVDQIPLSYLENMFEKMHDLGYKHMGIIFKWRDWEPKEPGVYDWTIVDQYIEWCDKYDMSWDIVYFGSNSCGGTRLTNGDVGQGEWWMRNVPEYLDQHDGYWHNGNYVGVNHCPVLKGENYEYIKANEIRAIQALMNHLAEVDTNKRTATFQVMNEPDWHPSFNTNYGGYNAVEKRYVKDWISDVAVAIKASDYSLITRINGGHGMPHEEYAEMAKLPGIDMCGDDSYTTSVSFMRELFEGPLKDVGFPHSAENGGSYTNTSSLVLTTLLLGGGYHGWQFNDHSWDDGMADTGKNGDYWKWQLGQPIQWREQGQDMGRLNPAMNKISDKLACAPLKSMAGFNIETDYPNKNYKKLQMLDGVYAGYECSDASVGLAVKDGNDVYLVSDSAAQGDGTANFLSYQEIVSASYVGYYRDDVGVADEEKVWIEEQPVEVVKGEDGIYRVPVKEGETLKITFGDNKLSSMTGLTTSAGDLKPAFDTNTHTYELSVGADVSEISVNAELSDENAKYLVNGRELTSGVSSQKIPLQFGENEIKVQIVWDGFSVETEDNVYTIKVYRSEMNFNGGTYENIALKKKISSPNYKGGWWHGINGAVDGSETSMAQPSSPNPVWHAEIELDGVYAVDRFRFVGDAKANIPTKFNVKVSEDGKEWETVCTAENFNGGVYDQSFAPHNASYVMVEVLEAKTGNDCGWVAKEIEVYGVKDGSVAEFNAQMVADSILSIPAYDGSGKVTYPKIPSGFTMKVAQSTNEEIVALDGAVTPGKFDETVYLKFEVVNDKDKKDTAFSKVLPLAVKAQQTTPQNINIALNKSVTGTSGSGYELAVDGDYATRYVAGTGYPQSLTVDLGQIMEFNQVVTTWDAARPAEYKIEVSSDQKEWNEVDTFALDREGTVINDIESTRGRYLKVTGTKRGPNTNQFALMEVEVFNRMVMPKEFVIQDITLSDGTISPAFDKNVSSYSAVTGKESITVTVQQESADAYAFVNGKKVMSGTASEPIALENGANVINISVQDPDNAGNVVQYQLSVIRKEFDIEGYNNVVLNKKVTTPGFDVGYWHPLKQINDGNMGTFAQSSSKAVLDYQFDLGGCFMVDEFEIYTGNNNRPTSFDVKTSLDGENWVTVLSVNSFDPSVTKYAFEPVYAQYILVDNKTSDGNWMAVNEIVVNGVERTCSAEAVAHMLKDLEVTSAETEVVFVGLPEGFEATITESSNPDVIALDKTVTHTDAYETVDVTVQIKNGEDIAETTIQVTVQPKKLTNQVVLAKIISQMPSNAHEQDQTIMLLPEAPAGFTVTYKDDQDGSNAIEIDGNVMTIRAGLSDFSLPINVRVSGEEGAEPKDEWCTTFFKGRSKTAQEVLEGLQVSEDGSQVVIQGAEEGYDARVIASSNQYVIDAAGNITTPDTTTIVDVYVQVTKLKDQTTAMKTCTFTIAGKVDKTALETAIADANAALNKGKDYTPESVEALMDALVLAEEYQKDPTITQNVVDKLTEKLTKAIKNLELKVNKENLDALLKMLESKNLDLSKYTDETVKVYKEALKNAEKIMADEKLSIKDQETVDNAVKALKAAYEGLKKIDSGDSGKLDDGDKNKPSDKDNVPKTGDYVEIAPILFLAIAAFTVGIAVTVFKGKKKRK